MVPPALCLAARDFQVGWRLVVVRLVVPADMQVPVGQVVQPQLALLVQEQAERVEELPTAMVDLVVVEVA
jgi:hypothetical protein